MSVINEDLIEYIVIHCAATKASMDVTAEDINSWHKQRGWTEVGYHFFIRRDGRIEVGRDLDTPGAHVKGFNKRSWAVCMAGGIDDGGEPEDNFASIQYQSLHELIVVLKKMAPQAMIRGHNEFPNVHKACPSFDVQEWLSDNF